MFTGETWEFWEHDKPTNFEGHFDNDKNLIVCYNATAEIGSFLNLHHLFLEIYLMCLSKLKDFTWTKGREESFRCSTQRIRMDVWM